MMPWHRIAAPDPFDIPAIRPRRWPPDVHGGRIERDCVCALVAALGCSRRPDRLITQRRWLPRHLVSQPGNRRQVPLEILRRARDLPAAAAAHRDLCAQGEQDLLLLWRHNYRQRNASSRNGLLLRPHHGYGAEADHPDGQEHRRRARQLGDEHRRRRLHLDFFERPRHCAALLYSSQPQAVRHQRVRPRRRNQLLLLAAVVYQRAGDSCSFTHTTTTGAAICIG